MATLYEITGEYTALLDYADDPEYEQTFIDTLESVKGELDVKAEQYAAIIKEIDAETKKFDAEIERLTQRRDVMKANVKRMKERLMGAMKTMGVPEIKTDHFKLKIVNNGGLQPLVVDGDVPQNMTKVTVAPDNDKIREYLKDNECTWAHLEPRGQHLRIS